MKPIHSMTKNQNTTPACGCKNCACRRGLRCRCHDYNALLTLTLWDFGQIIRRRQAR